MLTVLGTGRKLGGVVKHLTDGSDKRICWLNFEFKIPHAIEKRSKTAEKKSRIVPSVRNQPTVKQLNRSEKKNCRATSEPNAHMKK